MRQYTQGNRKKWVLTNTKRHLEVHARKFGKTSSKISFDEKSRKIDHFFEKKSNNETLAPPVSSTLPSSVILEESAENDDISAIESIEMVDDEELNKSNRAISDSSDSDLSESDSNLADMIRKNKKVNKKFKVGKVANKSTKNFM